MTPLADAQAALREHAGSWNRVVLTAGIDNTNWGDVLSVIGMNSILSAQFLYNDGDCADALQVWDGWNVVTGVSKPTASFTDDVRTIVSGLIDADRAARILWVEYYNIAGTGNIGAGTPAPAISL
jgi:hypothetical protein